LDRIKQELRIDSGKDSHSYEEMEADKENLQKAVDELRKRLDAIAQEKEALEKETDEQIQAQMNKQESVNRLTKSIEQKNRGIKAKSDTVAENEKNAQKIDGERRDLEPKIQEMKKSQDKILEEFREVDRERSTLLAMQQKSEFETQVD
jgi:chromosome segregation ATPase